VQKENLRNHVASVLIDEKRLQKRVGELAQQITKEFEDIEKPMLLCVLKGAFVFLSDLTRLLKMPHEVDFMAISSYGSSTTSSGAVRIVLDLTEDISGRHILIVEDIIDSGRTLDYMRRNLLARSPASLRICTLLNKPSRRTVDVPVDYIGFDIPDEFVVGYGLDFAQLYRNFPFIAVLKPEVFGGAPPDA
jgi:hypoxanthine phosphoribosyltransferase